MRVSPGTRRLRYALVVVTSKVLLTMTSRMVAVGRTLVRMLIRALRLAFVAAWGQKLVLAAFRIRFH